MVCAVLFRFDSNYRSEANNDFKKFRRIKTNLSLKPQTNIKLFLNKLLKDNRIDIDKKSKDE